MRARVAHAAVVLAGLVILLYPLTIGSHPRVVCRGVEMHAGQSCPKAGSAGVQTYEQRLRTANEAKPVIAGVGLLVTVFGAVLLRNETRTRRTLPEDRVEDGGGVG